jgi:LPXTG-motif cell wall-anchored protein
MQIHDIEGKGEQMDTTVIVRIIAGVLALAVLAIVIYRRKKAA